MDPQTIINIAAGAALAVIGWLARELWGAVKAMREDLQRLEVELPKVYVTKTDWSQAWQDVSHKLDKISDKIDRKADKQ